MKTLRNITALLLIAALTLCALACTAKNEPTQPTAAPVVTEAPAAPTDAPKASATEEPVSVPDPEPLDVTGDWYTAFYGTLQILTLNSDGTYEMLSPEITDEGTAGTWELQEDKIILDGGWLYDPMVIENGTLVWNDLLSNEIVYTREKPENTGYTPANPVEVTDNSVFYGAWKAEYITDTAHTVTFSASAFGLDLIIRIDENTLAMTNEGEEQALSYTVENGVLTFTVDGTEAYLTPLDDGTLAMTVAGEDALYIFVPIK